MSFVDNTIQKDISFNQRESLIQSSFQSQQDPCWVQEGGNSGAVGLRCKLVEIFPK